MRMKKAALIIALFGIGQLLPALARDAAAIINYSGIAQPPLRELAFGLVAYLLQLCLTLLALVAWPGLNGLRAGLNLNNRRLSLALLRRFLLVWGGLALGFFAVALVWFPWFGPYLQAQCPPNGLSLLKAGLIGVLLAPPIEELLYRGVLLGALGGAGHFSLPGGRLVLSGSALFSGLTFMVAHIGVQLFPTFAINHVDPLQLGITFLLVIFWGWVFEKTGSLLCPVLAHAGANAIQFTLGYLASWAIAQGLLL